LEQELAHPMTRDASRGLELGELAVLKVEPGVGGSWELTTDETWRYPMAQGPSRTTRLRFRYTLVSSRGGLRVDAMEPILPEAVREAP
jgi:hypothetical protein